MTTYNSNGGIVPTHIGSPLAIHAPDPRPARAPAPQPSTEEEEPTHG